MDTFSFAESPLLNPLIRVVGGEGETEYLYFMQKPREGLHQ
jgi:hypothetical protein